MATGGTDDGAGGSNWGEGMHESPLRDWAVKKCLLLLNALQVQKGQQEDLLMLVWCLGLG